MRRVSAIRSNRDFDMEKRREELRDIRWARRRSQLITAVIVVAVIVLLVTGSSGDVVKGVRALIGL
jgi:hypothetical protein